MEEMTQVEKWREAAERLPGTVAATRLEEHKQRVEYLKEAVVWSGNRDLMEQHQ